MLKRLVSLLALTVASSVAADSWVFTNGHLVTMLDEQARPGELLVTDSRIVAVGSEVARPQGARVIDMQGGYLMPGLAEMHAHVPSPGQGQQYRDDVLFLWAAAGITTARGMLGHPDHLVLKKQLAAQEVLGPRLITSGPSFNGNSVQSPEQAAEMVTAQHAAGYDFLKIHPGMSRAEYDAMADRAHEVGIAFAGHVPASVGLSHALAKKQLTIDHLDGYVQEIVGGTVPGNVGFFGSAIVDDVDESKIAAIVQKTVASGAWIVPTETLIENFADAARLDELTARPEVAYLPKPVLANYRGALRRAGAGAAQATRLAELRKRILKALHEAGAGILLGADSPQIFNVPGFSIHRELAATVAAGLTPFEALQTGTVNVARFFDMERDLGTLEAGKIADLVLVAGNPLADIGNAADVAGVMLRGRWVDAEERAAGLADIAARYAAQD